MPTSSIGLLQEVHKHLRKLPPTLQFLFAVAGLIVAIYFGNKLRNRLLDSQDNIAKALSAKLEATAHPHRGVASFLVSGFEQLPASSQGFNTQLEKTLGSIDAEVEKLAKDVRSFDPDTALQLLDLKLTESSVGQTSTLKQAITRRSNKSAFLVVPALSLRRKSLLDEPLNDQSMKAALKDNTEVLFDLKVATVIEPFLAKLDYMPIGSLSAIQTYFISESGVILLRAAGVQDNENFYKDEFAPHTQFMDRPYFWKAVISNPQQTDVGPFNYRTEPYIDLGGNGLVITYSRKVDLNNHRAGVICVDMQLPSTSGAEIEKRLKDLGAETHPFSWIIGGMQQESSPSGFQWVEDQLRGQSREEQSLFLGAIALESDYVLPSQSKEQSGVIRFTVPLKSIDYGNGMRKTNLLCASINFDQLSGALTRDLFWFSAGIILLVVASSNIFYDYSVIKREMNSVLEKISKVMQEADTPFAWLNERNEFRAVNQSLLDVLDYKNIESLRERAPTYRSLITGRTQRIYDEVLAKSGDGKETGKYTVDMLTRTGEVLEVVAHGERIPYPTFWRRGIPHRFGVFLKVSKKTDLDQAERRSAPPAAETARAKHA